MLAHLLGDWVFQPRKMAVKKGEQTISGWLYCILHVAIYTGCFIVLCPGHSPLFYWSIAVPHFIIDKWSLVSYWLKIIDGHFWWEVYKEPQYRDTFEERVAMAFGGLRYAVCDNTIHLVCLYLTNIYF